MSSEVRDLAIVGVMAAAPVALILIVAMLRSYDIKILFSRRRRDDD